MGNPTVVMLVKRRRHVLKFPSFWERTALTGCSWYLRASIEDLRLRSTGWQGNYVVCLPNSSLSHDPTCHPQTPAAAPVPSGNDSSPASQHSTHPYISPLLCWISNLVEMIAVACNSSTTAVGSSFWLSCRHPCLFRKSVWAAFLSSPQR